MFFYEFSGTDADILNIPDVKFEFGRSYTRFIHEEIHCCYLWILRKYTLVDKNNEIGYFHAIDIS